MGLHYYIKHTVATKKLLSTMLLYTDTYSRYCRRRGRTAAQQSAIIDGDEKYMEAIKQALTELYRKQSTIKTLTAQYEKERDTFVKTFPEAVGTRQETIGGVTVDISSGVQREVMQDAVKERYPQIHAMLLEKAVADAIAKFKVGITALGKLLTEEQIDEITVSVAKAISLTFRD